MIPYHSQEIARFLDSQYNKPLVRFITCGSVDDGKSTLIGRLLFEKRAIFDDQLESLERDSRKYGTQGNKIDLALLVDGLQAEREQGITIDVAYRFFATDRRRYIVADTPGHEQYTRNMATGASTADIAVILIDARKGILTQTRRHIRIVAMMGIRHVVLAVNKMDLMGFSQQTFDAIVADYDSFASDFGFKSVQPIPLSALHGDNVLRCSNQMPWYKGPSLMEYLDEINLCSDSERQDFRLPIQWINRPNLDFRGFCGTVAKGTIKVGDVVQVLPSGVQTSIKQVFCGFNEVPEATKGQAITLTLNDEVDASRGDVLVIANHPPEVSNKFEAKLLWMSENPIISGREYLFKLATKEVSAVITQIKYKEDINTGKHLVASSLSLNEIACVNLLTSEPIVFEPYATSRVLGSFILIDKQTFQTVGAGMLNFASRCVDHVYWQALEINKKSRADLKRQKAHCFWMTGLSGSGKSTLANLLEKRLYGMGKHTFILDGDNLRHGLNVDLGFTEVDRKENSRRIAEVARLMVDAGLIVIVSFISPFRVDREWASSLFSSDEFTEVFVDSPLVECERRDVKGLYKKAREGELNNFTGIDSSYEIPMSPDVHLHTDKLDEEVCVEILIGKLGLTLE